jgi:hypothetical protein
VKAVRFRTRTRPIRESDFWKENSAAANATSVRTV